MSRRRRYFVPLIIALFGLMFLGSGLAVFRGVERAGHTATDLQHSGLNGIVTDARIHVQTDTTTANAYAHPMELTFTGADGVHIMTTDHFPHIPVDQDQSGWYSDFQGKPQILGQAVKYRLGSDPAVELVTQLPAVASAPWGFAQYFSLTFAGIGVLVLIGAVLTAVRAARPD